MFVLLGDPVNRAIIEELLITDRATPAQLATEMQTRFAIGRAAVSSHITQLEDALVLTRELDRTVRLIDPHGLQVVLVEAHRLASTATGGAALTAEALRANLEERLQDRQSSRPDISAFFESQPMPAFGTDGPIQRPDAIDAPQSQALPSNPKHLSMYWVRTNSRGPLEGSPRRSAPAVYHPPPAHIVLINADWPPLIQLVERQTSSARSAEAWDATYPLIEREIADAIGAAMRNAEINSSELDASLNDRLTRRLPQIEQRLRDTLRQRRAQEP